MSDVGRRRLVNGLLWTSVTGLVAAIVYPVARFLSPPRRPESEHSRVLAAKVSEMQGISWKVFPFGQEPGILIRTSTGEYRAFRATCTHLDCTVQFEEKTKRIWCPCHNGWYDLDGRNVAGPPPRPLEAFEVQLAGDDIFVTRG
jgi:Rieske Fe-S protein